MKKKIVVVYMDGSIVLMPFCKMDIPKVMGHYPEITSIYAAFITA